MHIPKLRSFYDASDEAAISHFYGDIHSVPAVKYGQVAGKELGEYVIIKNKDEERIIFSSSYDRLVLCNYPINFET